MYSSEKGLTDGQSYKFFSLACSLGQKLCKFDKFNQCFA